MKKDELEKIELLVKLITAKATFNDMSLQEVVAVSKLVEFINELEAEQEQEEVDES